MPTLKNPIVVTGSSGLLGRPVCLEFADAGFDVYGFDRKGPPGPPTNHPRVHSINCDVSDPDSLRGALAQLQAEIGNALSSVVHLAAYYDFSGEDSPLYKDVTVDGTRRLLDGLSSFDIEQFVFSSSMLVHEPCDVGDFIREDSPCKAKWPYPQSKIETERVIVEEFPEFRSVLLRIAGVYTDWGTQPTLVQQIKRIYEKQFESHFFPGDTEAGQSSVYLDDAVRAVVASVEKRDAIEPRTAILIGESQPPAYGQLQDAIAHKLHGDDWSTLYVPPLLAKAGAAVTDAMAGGESFIKPFMVNMADDNYALDITRARQSLGWQPQHKLMEEVPRILQRLIDDPVAWYQHNDLDPSEIPSRAL